jgi:hypothetical protein
LKGWCVRRRGSSARKPRVAPLGRAAHVPHPQHAPRAQVGASSDWAPTLAAARTPAQFLSTDPAAGTGHQDDMLFFVRPPQQQAPAEGKARAVARAGVRARRA